LCLLRITVRAALGAAIHAQHWLDFQQFERAFSWKLFIF
jgi:hypothetical protein